MGTQEGLGWSGEGARVAFRLLSVDTFVFILIYLRGKAFEMVECLLHHWKTDRLKQQ